jgi:hypothetical protein
VSPRDNDIVHLGTMAQKLMPVFQNLPQGALPPEGIAPLVEAMKHFAAHIQQAEAKGASKEEVAKFKDMYKQAISHITAGQNVPPPPDIAPAAAQQNSGRNASPMPATQQGAGSFMRGGQSDVISQISHPPRPETAA